MLCHSCCLDRMSCYSVIVTMWDSGSSEDLQTECISAPRSPTPSLRSPLKSTSGGSVKRRTRTTSASYTSAGDGPVVRSGTRTIYTAGRPPWYDSQGQLKEAFVIGIYYCCCFRFLFGWLDRVCWFASASLANPYCQSMWMSVCMYVGLSGSLRSNISETNEARGSVTMGSL